MNEIHTGSSAQRPGSPFPAIVRGTVCTGFCGAQDCVQLLCENEMLIRAEIIIKETLKKPVLKAQDYILLEIQNTICNIDLCVR